VRLKGIGPPWAHELAGRVEEHAFDSQALTGNPLGDPHVRPLLVQLPPGYDDDRQRRYPAIYVLQGLTGQVDMWRNRKAFQPTVLERVDAVWRQGASPAIVVYVDAWTRLGGSQFLDSPGTGRYHTYVCEELVPFIDGRYRTLAAREHRGVAGKSSGGYGAMVTPMLRPDLFSALATHAGDALFEGAYWPDARAAVRALRDHHDGSYDAFWADFAARAGRMKPSDEAPLNMWCMAACYSADADGTVRIPFDPATGAIVHEVWDRWLARDPVRMAADAGEALRSMRAIWIDAGRSDDYYLDLGAQAFHAAVLSAGVDTARVHFELFAGTHSDLEWRYPMAIGWLAERLAADGSTR
jgi:S-formylglutathione hydrolase FrmB